MKIYSSVWLALVMCSALALTACDSGSSKKGSGYSSTAVSSSSVLVPNATNGKVIFQAQCASCHPAQKVIDSSKTVAVLVNKISTTMPKGAAAANLCTGQCAQDVTAYIKSMASSVSSSSVASSSVTSSSSSVVSSSVASSSSAVSSSASSVIVVVSSSSSAASSSSVVVSSSVVSSSSVAVSSSVVSSSSVAVSSSSSSAPVGDAVAGKVTFGTSCNICHSDQLDGTFKASTPFNVNALKKPTGPTKADLADYIKLNMPLGNVGSCDDTCSKNIAAYLWTYFRKGNLVTDSQFEGATPSGWFAYGSATLALDATAAYHGAKGLKVTGRAQTWQSPALTLKTLVTANTTYKLFATVKHNAAASDNLIVTVKKKCKTDTEDSYIPVATSSATATNTWTKMEGEFTVPDVTCELENYDIYVEGPAVNVDLFIDEFYVYPKP